MHMPLCHHPFGNARSEMEKLLIHSPKAAQLQHKPWKPKLIGSEPSQRRPPIWDCGSSLYDSFELSSLQSRLDSARHARSLSLPHLGAGHRLQPPTRAKPRSTRGSKLSRSLRKLLKSVFFRGKSKVVLEDDVVFEKGNGVLSAIPEAPEIEKKAGLVAPERSVPRSRSLNVISSRGLAFR